MGKEERPWQDIKYVLGYFGKTVKRARKSYSSYVEEGLDQGRRDELTGGGMIAKENGFQLIESET